MKKRKFLAICFVLSLTAATVFSGCGSSSGSDSSKDISTVSGSDGNTEDSKEAVTVAEQVLYDANNVKITATGLSEDDSWFGTSLTLLIENNSDQSLTIQARDANVNGYMVNTSMSANVAAGMKANDSLIFETSGLEECGIEQIATMEFSFTMLNSDTFETVFDSDMITVNTSIAEGYTQTYDDSGNVLLDANGIKIVGKGLSTDDSFWGPGVILYIENNSDQNITVQTRDTSVNGFMVTSTISESVLVGKKAITAVQFYDTDLESNGITDITNVNLSFHVFNTESWDAILDSDPIEITF